MRPRNIALRDQLPSLLRRHPGARALDLAALADTSLASMTRMLKEPSIQALRVGKARASTYYLRRPLRGKTSNLPVYRIDTEGNAHPAGNLSLIYPEASVLDVAALGWPVDQEFASGVWPGLPYPLQDMRWQGFLGRNFAHQHHAALGISANPKDWSDDEALHALMLFGSDTPGNLIVGETALQRWLQAKACAATPIAPADLGAGYAALAQQAMAFGAVGSSAGGEFPKFAAQRSLLNSLTPHVIVKFAGQEAARAVQRWADLLVCEHLALQAVATLPGVRSARSRLLHEEGRTFLEIERFDRHGPHGRSPLCSLATLESALLSGSRADWATWAERLHQARWLSRVDCLAVQHIEAFGRLIGNTDMHYGNLSFVPHPEHFELAPVYDMLPMAYAPLTGGELPTLQFAPALPTPTEKPAWLVAHGAASAFWQSVAQDMRVSPEFATLAQGNVDTLARLKALA